ncbi:MAG TPA: alpha-amylase family glycosyl hydrolase [Xanthomonadaceae bacterium]|nr:alpha-amylase family glycosyl hydrolase [Xanthomonadaceae bacterium]
MRIPKASPFAWLAVLALAGSPSAGGEDLRLHVQSPDWRDQIVYFVMIDRFDDGEPSNNDQGTGEFDPADHRKYSGGDLAGIARRIDYIRGLGATAVWITPPVANQWWDGELRYGGYHGYWAEHFMKVDAHYGTLDDYRTLSDALHRAGMYLIQDVVVNHTGNFFTYRDGWDPDDPTRHFRLNRDSRPVAAPTQWPFSLNDVRVPAHREAGIYHWTPVIADFTDREQELSYQLADLDDLATGNPVVRRALRESFGHWIREVGVDGFRVDTAYHVEPGFFRDFLYDKDAEHPGMTAVARATGREDFLAFGEGFGIDRAFDDRHQRKLETYVRDAAGRPLLSSMINFPLYGSAVDVFARGRPSAELGHRIRSKMAVHERPHLMPTFIDNHDVDRFLAGGSEAGLKQALLMLMTLPGIPTIYYGTEQGFRERRRAMFAGGYGSGGVDHFDSAAPLYRYLADTTALRREHRVFSRGVPTVLDENAAAAGALAWRMDHGDQAALVVFNTSDAESLLDIADSGWPAGTRLDPLFAIGGEAGTRVVGLKGRLTLKLPARAGWVWRAQAVQPEDEKGSTGDEQGPVLTLDSSVCAPMDPALHGDCVFTGNFALAGHARGLDRFLLVIDGDLGSAQTILLDDDGHWQARVDTTSMIDPGIEHSVVAWSESRPAVSERLRFRVERQWTLLAEVEDPAGDDHGPHGRYLYPTDPSFGDHRQADIRRVRVYGSGGALAIELDMHRVTQSWNPPNGFDHVAITAFIELPGRDDGIRTMPKQNADLAGDMRWHYRLRAGGWSNVLFSAAGAGADHEGTPVAPGARIEVDTEAQRIRFTLPAAGLGHPAGFAGARIHITTWDQDGAYRALTPQPGSHSFGGGDGSREPLVMDDATVVVPESTVQ